MALELWSSDDPIKWKTIRDKYNETREKFKKQEFFALDDWYLFELPESIKSRDPPFIKQEELSRLMKWKLMKGKWRPRLQSFVDGLSKKEVETESRKAFSQCSQGNIKEAFNTITTLKGVGPATASAIFAAFDPNVPFMCDEAMNCLSDQIGEKKYTLSHYLIYRRIINEKTNRLNENSTVVKEKKEEKEKEHSHPWTSRDVELTLWVDAMDTPNPKSPSLKRKNDSQLEKKTRKKKH